MYVLTFFYLRLVELKCLIEWHAIHERPRCMYSTRDRFEVSCSHDRSKW